MKNKKVAIIVAVIAILLIGTAIVVRLRSGDKSQDDSVDTGSSMQSSATEEGKDDDGNETTMSEDASGNGEASENSGLDMDLIESLYGSSSEAPLELSEEEKLLVKQAVEQILSLGGPWMLESDSSIYLSFTDDKYSFSGTADKKEHSYEIKSASSVNSKNGSLYVYHVELTDGRNFDVTAFNDDVYTLTADKTVFPELAINSELSFIKTAEIVVGSHKNENGMTDRERDEAGVSYITE